ncbi:hypothetical protein MKK70_11585 [Methylobacterium sp. E-041]|uniref:hypothetical protein n=1 Tax=Methylobacterium sp. E-041 TaxID=2836573 RepID=UPI001FB86C05|nr:hypothetical protein [Methylobacterium sp. E-041]MCJ2106004.1 hypothetical protein [Methylobacterium sp. E-041]
MQLHAHAQEELDATMRALTLGIQAVSEGWIAGLEYDPHDGLPNLIRDPDLDGAAWAKLLDALVPAWDRGLPALLAELLGVRASTGACQDAYQTPTMMHR